MKISALIALSELDFVTELDQIKAEIDAHRPLPKETEERIMQKLRLYWNYHSNAIEGNQLDYGETVAFLMHGITAKGKTLKDHLDIKGHNEAIHLLLSIVKEARGFSEVDIRTLHKMILVEPYESNAITAEGLPTKKQILLGEYKKMPNSVKTRTGEMHYYASPEETPIKMAELMAWYNEAKENNAIHPLVLAAVFHHEFAAIHPFDDGNGRMARILMNLILLQKNFPVVVVKKDDRNNYYSVLSQADENVNIPLVQYMAGLLKNSLEIYLKGAKGEDIEEKDDIDKEIALFKQSLQGEVNVKDVKTDDSIRRVVENIIQPFVTYFKTKSEQLNDLFFENEFIIYTTIYDSQKGDIFPVYFTDLEKVSSSNNLNNSTEVIYIEYKYRNIRSSAKTFDISCNIKIVLQDKLIKISYSKHDFIDLDDHIIKLYNERWKLNEMESFVNRIIINIMGRINSKMNESIW